MRAVAALVAMLAGGLVSSGSAAAAAIYSYQADPRPLAHMTGQEARSQRSHDKSPPRSPSGPPLSPTLVAPGESTADVPSSEGDPLVDNGLSSPLCRRSGELSGAAQANCQASNFVAAPAPTKSYEIDVNIDVGPVGLGKGGLLSAIQDAFVIPMWNALVWVVHALVVMLEWCYTFDLLNEATMGGVAHSLRQAQASFTQPWLALVLAVASVLAIYNGLVRRRVTETLGHVLATIAMMSVGLWVIADPLGTIGVVGGWADETSLATLGVVAQGTPTNAPRTLADSMRSVFASAIEMPWCYLEFGNVRWCSDPALLDPRLRETGLRIEAREEAMIGCNSRSVAQLCVARGSPAAHVVERSDRLLRQATTNGALFLAFPANGPERNSVTETGSLLHMLCQASDDTKCRGSTAAQAEFRSAGGTFPRMIGLVLIVVGVLGMTALFGLIAARLLVAALMGLFLLLLAPAAVLAPALGEGGRILFCAWLARLFGAVGSKLLFSFLLGVMLTMQRLLTSLQSLGWWTQWLLISTFWWAIFLKRHQAAAFIQSWGRSTSHVHRPISRQMENARQARQMVRHPVTWTKRKILGEPVLGKQPEKPSSHDSVLRFGERQNAPPTSELGSDERGRHGSVHRHRAERKAAKRALLVQMLAKPEAALLDRDVASAEMRANSTARVKLTKAARWRSRHGVGNAADDLHRPPELTSGMGRTAERPRSRLESHNSEEGCHEVIEPRTPASGSVPSSVSPSRVSPERPIPDSDDTPESPAAGVEATGERASIARERRSSIMEDARAVAEGRKRQLGFQRPAGSIPSSRDESHGKDKPPSKDAPPYTDEWAR